MATKINLDGCATYKQLGTLSWASYHSFWGKKLVGYVKEEPVEVLRRLAPKFSIYAYKNVEFPFGDTEIVESQPHDTKQDLGVNIQESKKEPTLKISDLEERILMSGELIDKEADTYLKSGTLRGEISNYDHELIRSSKLSRRDLLKRFRENHIGSYSSECLQVAIEKFNVSMKAYLLEKLPKNTRGIKELSSASFEIDSFQLEKFRRKYRIDIGMCPEYLEILSSLGKEIKDENDWINFYRREIN